MRTPREKVADFMGALMVVCLMSFLYSMEAYTKEPLKPHGYVIDIYAPQVDCGYAKEKQHGG